MMSTSTQFFLGLGGFCICLAGLCVIIGYVLGRKDPKGVYAEGYEAGKIAGKMAGNLLAPSPAQQEEIMKRKEENKNVALITKVDVDKLATAEEVRPVQKAPLQAPVYEKPQPEPVPYRGKHSGKTPKDNEQ